MSKLNKEILVSGCGISWSGQTKKTWVSVLKAVGAKIIDVGGPAVSNQWIINSAADYVLSESPAVVIIQLTSIGKLDVEVTTERVNELVTTDSIRNFTFKNIWPSSASLDHPAKQLWHKWLYSPALEITDIRIKLSLLKEFLKSKNIDFFVFLGYNIRPEHNLKNFLNLITLPEFVIYEDYMASDCFKKCQYKGNHVPELEYQIELATKINQICQLGADERLNKLQQQFKRLQK